MERHQAFKYVADAREEALQLLKWVNAERLIGKEAREALMRARDVLHICAQEFSEGDAMLEHEDLFLPIFDALSFCTGVLYGCDWRRWHDTFRAFVLANTGEAIKCLEHMNRCALAY
ncbi:MAG TPA: hypothetical protein VKT72_07340 [Candidatus Baltobacteraceae bacterium]|nr:hypothetical protein [Candidatus Baltobacteraceae bacterium]